jgi:putative flippase GtrA
MENNKKDDVVRFFKFLIFSCGAGLIQILTFTLLNEVFHFNYWVCYLTGLVLSVLFNFTVNKAYTFKSADNVPKCMALIFLFYVFFTPISTIAEDYFTRSVNEYIITLSIMVANFVLEFLYCRFVVYRKTINTK